ncbi:unnamed protein product [Adineta steineri]|uniref:G-protein coupled receptors family 1 profile domain-containing protein n=1 Tax=Adineta steineri TaxID=433720 RepID=A0A814DNI8_9BILA|nr:unnamed protein product [Adineta steineri]CAF0956474.1 unnamed protein product [Adineta steineri]CAF0961496.1 unnamed protein product [Adineta steineri]
MLSNETSGNLIEFHLFERIFMTIVFACICTIGAIGNIIVLIVTIRKQRYRFVTNCYIINLAITDLLFLIISVPFTTYLGLTDTWPFSRFINCHVHIYIAHILLQATCYTLAAMSIDRYFYVINSHPRPPWRTPLNAFIICIIIWIVSIVLAYPNSLLSYSPSEKNLNITNDCSSTSSSQPSIALCLYPFCLYYMIPLIIIAICYTRLCIYMKNISNSIKRYKTSLTNGSRLVLKRRRVTRTLFSLTCVFAICWFPIHFLELLNCRRMLSKFYLEHQQLLNTIRVTAHALSYFNSCINPVLYALCNRESCL